MKRILTAVVASAALTLTACGGGSSDSGSGSNDSATTQGASVKVGDTISAKELGGKTSAAASKAVTANVKTTSGDAPVEGVVNFGDTPSFKMEVDEQGNKIEMIYVDKVLYLGGDSLASSLNGKKFAKIDPNGTDPMSQMMAPMMQVLDLAAQPAQMLEAVDGLEAKVVAVDGDTVTYETAITAEQAKQIAEKLLGGSDLPNNAANAEAMTVTQVVGKDDLLQSVKTVSGQQTTEFAYSDWGSAPKISAPPASEVGSLSM
ncbi:hypothetical protein [Janibacter sp. GXQ6167]|uniref:hypothetical protein n=1 Tax=Janibacter sp. GXQ6167 TaxID=3240791 RepID=UPI00352510AA